MNAEILMDESEFLESTVSPDALRQVLKMLGPKCKDKLLVPRADDA